MALTLTLLNADIPDVWGRTNVRIYQAQPASSDYATAGWVITGLTLNTSGGVSWLSGLGLRVVYAIWAWAGPKTSTPVTATPYVQPDMFHGKLQAFESAGGTPTGTISSTSSAPTITTVNDSGSPTKALGELSGALSSNGAVTGITGVQAPTITSTFTGGAAAAGALKEYANGSDLSAYTFTLVLLGND